MEKEFGIIGIGGVFFRANQVKETKEWYSKYLMLQQENFGAIFFWRNFDFPENIGSTSWSVFSKDNKYFPENQDYMINYRVKNLETLLLNLEKEGIHKIGQIEEFEYGKFAWIKDLNGIQIELWEPIDTVFLK